MGQQLCVMYIMSPSYNELIKDFVYFLFISNISIQDKTILYKTVLLWDPLRHNIIHDNNTIKYVIVLAFMIVNTLRPGQNGRRFADDTFKRIFLNENFRISIKISLKFVPKGPINNNPALVQIMAWRRLGDKPLSEPMMVTLLTHICVTRPQWVKSIHPSNEDIFMMITRIYFASL